MTSYTEGLEKQIEELQEQLAATQGEAAIGKELKQIVEYMNVPIEVSQKHGCYLVQWGSKSEIPISKHLWEYFKNLAEIRKEKQKKHFQSLMEMYDKEMQSKEQDMAAGFSASAIKQFIDQQKAFQKLDDDH